MTKLILGALMILACSVANAQTGSGSAGSAAPAADPAPVPPPAPPAPPSAAELRKTCVAAMNADRTFADAIVKTAKEMSCADANVLKAHEDAQLHIQKNERHVILAYGAMWAIAALFVLYLWRRLQVLKSELALLRRDLDAATKEGK